jgi:hypothetical protein
LVRGHEGGHATTEGGEGLGPTGWQWAAGNGPTEALKQGRPGRMTGGVPATMRGSGSLNLIQIPIQTNSNKFKPFQILTNQKGAFPSSKKLK